MSEDKKPTQKDIDNIYPAAKYEWDRMLKESGKTKLMFTMSKEAIQFLGEYQNIKETVEAEGFTMPDLLEGTKVTLS